MNFCKKFFIAITLILSCASAVPHIRDVTELAPPGNVSYTFVDESVKLSWQASPHESKVEFAGYNIYLAQKSLILTAMKELPAPVILDKQHEFVFTELEKGAKYFVHIRSRNEDGNLSLPSLPELTFSF